MSTGQPSFPESLVPHYERLRWWTPRDSNPLAPKLTSAFPGDDFPSDARVFSMLCDYLPTLPNVHGDATKCMKRRVSGRSVAGVNRPLPLIPSHDYAVFRVCTCNTKATHSNLVRERALPGLEPRFRPPPPPRGDDVRKRSDRAVSYPLDDKAGSTLACSFRPTSSKYSSSRIKGENPQFLGLPALKRYFMASFSAGWNSGNRQSIRRTRA